jgi:hypothetical protein
VTENKPNRQNKYKKYVPRCLDCGMAIKAVLGIAHSIQKEIQKKNQSRIVTQERRDIEFIGTPFDLNLRHWE